MSYIFPDFSFCCAVLSCSVMYDSLQPQGLQPTRLLCSWGFSRQDYWNGLPCPSPQDLPNPGIEPRSPTSQMDSLLTEPSGKPKNTGVGSLSLLQGIFLTRESNQSLICIAGRFFTIFTLILSCISLHFSTLTTLYYNIVFPVLSLWREFEILFSFYLFIFN